MSIAVTVNTICGLLIAVANCPGVKTLAIGSVHVRVTFGAVDLNRRLRVWKALDVGVAASAVE